MIKGRENIIAQVSVLGQVIITLACFLAAIWGTDKFITPIVEMEKEFKLLFVLLALLSYLVYDYFGLGKMVRVKMYITLLFEYVAALFASAVGFTFIFYFIDSTITPWLLVTFYSLTFVVLYLYKITSFRILKYMRKSGRNIRSVLVIADKDSCYFIDRLIDTRDWGYKLYAICTDSPEIILKYGKDFTILPLPDKLSSLIDEKAIDEVMYCMGDLDQERIKHIIYDCSEVGVTFRMHSEFLRFVKLRSEVASFNSLPFITFSNTPSNYLALEFKKALDYLVAGIIVLLISPILITIAALIKLDDGGPIFFKQIRSGLNGREFGCLKFRTMVINAEALKEKLMEQNEQEGPVFKIKKDPRVTKIGNFLRKTSLDELPQFLNVLMGDMAIVGPRPPIPSEVAQYERWQRRRLSMKPGITCIWQVSGRNNIPFEEWMKLDMQYIDNWSLRLDLVIFLKTFKVMATGDGQ